MEFDFQLFRDDPERLAAHPLAEDDDADVEFTVTVNGHWSGKHIPRGFDFPEEWPEFDIEAVTDADGKEVDISADEYDAIGDRAWELKQEMSYL